MGGTQQRPDSTGPAGAWDKVLQSNRAGAATNAEDFTQEFMSQLMGNTAANLPPPLVSNNVNGQRQHLQNNNSNQLNYQQEPGVRISTPTKQVSDVCVCCVFLFIYQAPSSVYTHSPSPYPQSYPTKPTIHAPTMSKLQTRENPNSSRFLTSCFLTLARPKARQIKCKVVSTKLAMVINITCILSSLIPIICWTESHILRLRWLPIIQHQHQRSLWWCSTILHNRCTPRYVRTRTSWTS